MSNKRANSLEGNAAAVSDVSWARARNIVASMEPVIYPIRQICQTAIGHPSRINQLLDGSVFPLQRLVKACGQDSLIAGGKGLRSSSSTREVLDRLPSDAVAAALVLHSVGKRVQSQPLQTIWRAFLEEALNRAALGFVVGQRATGFGAGRAMLAGFSSRAGLALLVANGTQEDAIDLLESLKEGVELRESCLRVYEVDPVHVGAWIVLDAGCGISACMGLRSCAVEEPKPPQDGVELVWWAAHNLIDHLATRGVESVSDTDWQILGFSEQSERDEVGQFVSALSRGGHSWHWML